jgi:pilus assembly protein CpaE
MQGDGPIKALLVSSDPEVLETMKRALATGSYTLAGEAWPGIEAVRLASEMSPELVLLHVEEPLGPAVNTVRSIGQAAPDAGIAVLSSLGDLDTIRRVMNAGAHDFATLPLRDDEMRDAARRAIDAVSRDDDDTDLAHTATGTVLCVVGPRGGVGKTALASNLAVALANETGTAVALVDLDLLFGSAAIALGVMPAATIQNWLQMRAGGQSEPVGRYLSAHRAGLKVLAAPLEPDTELEFGPQDVADIVTDLSSTHEFVVIDTPPSFTEISATAIELASATLLMTSGDIASLRAVRHVVQTLRAWGMDDERLRLVRNSPVPFRGASDEEMKEAIGVGVAWSLPHDREVFKTTDLGVSVVESNPRSPFARQATDMAHFFGRVKKPDQQQQRRRVLGVF